MTEAQQAFHIWFVNTFKRVPQVENPNYLDKIKWEGFQAAWDIQERNLQLALRQGEFGA